MIPATTFAGQDVAVFGLGRTGVSTCRALLAGGARPHAWDDNESTRDRAAAEGITLTDLNEADWSKFSALSLAPGVPLTHPVPHWTVKRAQDAGIEIIGDVEIYCRERQKLCPDAPFIAITGTNGKSTTTALIAHILESAGKDAQMGGNIGIPVLDLDGPAPDRLHVIEMSSYQIDLTPTLSPSVAVLLNLSPDHIDRHGTFENYAAVKARLLVDAQLCVIGIDDAPSRAIADGIKERGRQLASVSSADTTADVYCTAGLLHRRGSDQERPVADINGVVSLRGSHNAQNAAAATAVTGFVGVSDGDHATALRTFPGLPHRMEEVGRLDRAIFINDSKATNADSSSNALASFESDIYWIAGGLAKEGGITELQEYFPRIVKAYLIGEAADAFAKTLDGIVDYSLCGTLDAAIEKVTADVGRATASQPVVLLSPACASFDQFPSFEKRGDAFREQVHAIPGLQKHTEAKP
ncbi:MAG: UDP-N-acetylmuramoyl-L-alanine--D-glutamate ligase [Pseudomonadota bacterium]